MKKFFELGFVMMICSGLLLTSCTALKVTPREQGNAIGMAAYLGYSRIADRQSDEFKATVQDLWTTVNLIQSYDDLADSVDELTKAFDRCIASGNLSTQEQAACLVLKKRVTDRIGDILAGNLAKSEDATEFLLGVRDGVNEMMALGQ